MHDENKQGYRVLVRTVSGLFVLTCILIAGGMYFRVGIAKTYSPDQSNFSELQRIALLLCVAVFFACSFIRAKFVWFSDWPVVSAENDDD